jgi:hypothetical protein
MPDSHAQQTSGRLLKLGSVTIWAGAATLWSGALANGYLGGDAEVLSIGLTILMLFTLPLTLAVAVGGLLARRPGWILAGILALGALTLAVPLESLALRGMALRVEIQRASFDALASSVESREALHYVNRAGMLNDSLITAPWHGADRTRPPDSRPDDEGGTSAFIAAGIDPRAYQRLLVDMSRLGINEVRLTKLGTQLIRNPTSGFVHGAQESDDLAGLVGVKSDRIRSRSAGSGWIAYRVYRD